MILGPPAAAAAEFGEMISGDVRCGSGASLGGEVEISVPWSCSTLLLRVWAAAAAEEEEEEAAVVSLVELNARRIDLTCDFTYEPAPSTSPAARSVMDFLSAFSLDCGAWSCGTYMRGCVRLFSPHLRLSPYPQPRKPTASSGLGGPCRCTATQLFLVLGC